MVFLGKGEGMKFAYNYICPLATLKKISWDLLHEIDFGEEKKKDFETAQALNIERLVIVFFLIML